MDFTLKKYFSIITSGLDAEYQPLAVVDLFDRPNRSERHMVLRHDVDRKPLNALAMAKGEAELGVRATYYFRIIPETLKPEIISEIAELGHEIGYHYEDFHLAKYNPDRAYELFERHLATLQAIVPIRTIAMHGSPLARFNNMELWKHRSFSDTNVLDCTRSFDWSDYAFFTDTGRSFSAGRTNLRDRIGGKMYPEIKSSLQLATFVTEKRERKVQISTHPERWNQPGFNWVRQLAQDRTVNAIKLGLSLIK